MSDLYKIDAILGSKIMRIGEISQLHKGSIIDLDIPAGESIKCYHENKFLFSGEVMVFEKNLAIRINKSHNIDNKNEFVSNNTNKNNSTNEYEFENMDFSYLLNIKPKQLSNLLVLEHPQIIALILSHLETQFVSETLNFFEDELKTEILIRISKFGDISDLVIKKINFLLKQKIESMYLNKINIGGPEKVSDILNTFDKDKKDIYLSKIGEINMDLAEYFYIIN
jgi:hypothetical protein